MRTIITTSFGFLLLSSLPVSFTSFVYTPHLPKFNTSTIPVFFHSSVMNTSVFTDTDLQLIAKFPAVTIEKWMGCADFNYNNGIPPSQFTATLLTSQALKQLNPDISVFIWLDSLRIYSNKTYDPDAINIDDQFCVRNDVTPFLETNPPYLLMNSTNQPALESFCHFHVWNHNNINARNLWRDVCVNLTVDGLDGCGSDASQQNGTYIRGLTPEITDEWTTNHVYAVANTTQAVQARGGVVLGKIVEQLGVSTNGVLQEGCVASNATIQNLQLATALSLRDNTPYVYECHSNGTPDDMAAFLIGFGTNQYYGYGPWYTTVGGIWSWPPEFDYPLGEPLTPGIYDSTTATWSRQFSSGTKVTFNAKTNTGTINWAT